MIFQIDKQVKKRSIFKTLLLILIPVLLIVGGVTYFSVERWYSNNLEPVTTESSEDIIVVVEPGLSSQQIAEKLHEAGLIRNATAFNWYVDRQGVRQDLQAGTYRFKPTQSVAEITNQLTGGLVDTSLVTILPAKRIDEVEAQLIDFGFDATEVQQALAANYDHPLLVSKPLNSTLEGYVFPETYQVTGTTTVAELVERTFDQLYDQITDTMKQGLKTADLTLHEAVILASIVEKESGNPEDQPVIAQIFLKRLTDGLPLGADATFYYAAEVTGQQPAVDLDSPYNTRLVTGLPPGPIGNFNFSALAAVAEPADTDYLYFVSGDDGTTYYANTFAEHEQNVAEHCFENCLIQDR